MRHLLAIYNRDVEEMTEQLLLVDDDVQFCQLLGEYLEGEGFAVHAAHDGQSAIDQLRAADVDLTILDVMMPVKNGLDVLRELRHFSDAPVIMLTARGEEIDRIVGLELGADDYVAKPCNPREIVARVRAILRRANGRAPVSDDGARVITVDDVEMRCDQRSVVQSGSNIELTSTEYDVLETLLRSAGRVVEKAEVSERALKRVLGPYDRSIDMHISRLRRKLGPLGDGGERIKTVRGAGYLYVQTSPDTAE